MDGLSFIKNKIVSKANFKSSLSFHFDFYKKKKPKRALWIKKLSSLFVLKQSNERITKGKRSDIFTQKWKRKVKDNKSK